MNQLQNWDLISFTLCWLSSRIGLPLWPCFIILQKELHWAVDISKKADFESRHWFWLEWESVPWESYVHWLPCNALWRGGYLHGSNFVNLATLQHQQPPDTNYLASLIHPTRLISPRLNSQRCNCDQGIVRQNHFRSRLCPRRLPGNVCWKYCNGNVVGSQGRRAIWE